MTISVLPRGLRFTTHFAANRDGRALCGRTSWRDAGLAGWFTSDWFARNALSAPGRASPGAGLIACRGRGDWRFAVQHEGQEFRHNRRGRTPAKAKACRALSALQTDVLLAVEHVGHRWTQRRAKVRLALQELLALVRAVG